jgi:release factor glutamine methyltransferase
MMQPARQPAVPPPPPGEGRGEGRQLTELLPQHASRLAIALNLDRREARLEAQILIARALNVNRAWLIAHDRDVLTVAQQDAIESLIARRANGEPVAYLLAVREFYGLSFKVTPDVLIPRPDTELLVETALQHLPENRPNRILDLGTGSGAIAIALALQRTLSTVLAVDASPEALSIAQENARRLGAANVECVTGNWYATLNVKNFDIIVSNPPYIAASDPHLTSGDLRFEPRQALASGADGLDDLRQIIAGAPAHLAEGGWLLLEHGCDQAAAVTALLQQHGFEAIRTLQDLAGHDRVSTGRWPGQAG